MGLGYIEENLDDPWLVRFVPDTGTYEPLLPVLSFDDIDAEQAEKSLIFDPYFGHTFVGLWGNGYDSGHVFRLDRDFVPIQDFALGGAPGPAVP